MNWKKEIKSWVVMLGVFGLLYFTGLLATIMGGVQSLLLSSGVMKPTIILENKEKQPFDFTGQFTDMQGNTVGLTQYEGKTVFINLWATWCPPCRAEMPHISELYKKVDKTADVEFLMIALDDDFEKSKKYINDKGFEFPVVHAAYGLNASLQSQAIPTTLVVNPDGDIVFYQEGMSNFDTPEFREFLIGL